jgi:hypothetical protein
VRVSVDNVSKAVFLRLIQLAADRPSSERLFIPHSDIKWVAKDARNEGCLKRQTDSTLRGK